MEIEEVYKFKGVDGLHADLKRNFFYNGAPVRKVYNNGSISVMIGKSKRGIIKLRKRAYKSTVIKEELPF
jgi:hypothetical protein